MEAQETTGLVDPGDFLETSRAGGLIEVEKSRAQHQVQAQLVIAKRFPRDKTAAYTAIVADCRQVDLAEKAIFRFPRGGQNVQGPSIRLAESMARNWGNMNFGYRELERNRAAGTATVESFAWDMQTNTYSQRTFEVEFKLRISAKNGKPAFDKILTDPRDIYEMIANQAARRTRACILALIPADIISGAVAQCQKTLTNRKDIPIQDRVRKMVVAFTDIGVSQEMIEKRLGHKIDLTIAEEVVDLTSIYNSIREGQVKRSEFFDFKDGDDETAKEKVDQSREKFKAANAAVPETERLPFEK
jgi:hypothetical protein